MCLFYHRQYGGINRTGSRRVVERLTLDYVCVGKQNLTQFLTNYVITIPKIYLSNYEHVCARSSETFTIWNLLSSNIDIYIFSQERFTFSLMIERYDDTSRR